MIYEVENNVATVNPTGYMKLSTPKYAIPLTANNTRYGTTQKTAHKGAFLLILISFAAK
jgi:hypothetical protein